ncbi:MAG: Asp-tRNA(Asn)/Glu-tRNA(Gln) amidotransferase subunit GatA [Finegoldia sp.]|nr:Asp-tRNA(Asn)/Glu-tRNA(Gln) amidotransferase subunit GatA [Finegoldia sp.]
MIEELRNSFIEDSAKLDAYYNELDKEIKSKEDLNIFLTYDKAYVDSQLESLKAKKEAGEKPGKLYGIPLTVKDNISVKDVRMTCGSKMLENYIGIYDATVIERLKAEDCVIVGKVNMDEFAMGSTGETSYYGPTLNPLDKSLVPGGSSSGSAASIAADLAVISLGTDTGGSTRQPASFCNVVGYMPSYGSISRNGVVSMANTLDEVGILARSVEDVIDVFNIVNGYDRKDMTTIQDKLTVSKDAYDYKGKKVAFVDIEKYTRDQKVIEEYGEILEELRKLGADLEEVDFKYLIYANQIYNVIVSSEVSSNMSRFDGIRYGYQTDDYENTREMFVKTRTDGFGEEVKRRIAIGTYYLSSETDKEIYEQGLRLRRLLADEFKALFEKYDLFATPTSTKAPGKIDTDIKDPLAVFDSGLFNVIVNLSGLCAISLPYKEGISTSLQLIGNRRADDNLLRAALEFERR